LTFALWQKTEKQTLNRFKIMSKNKKGKVVSLKPAQLSAEKYIQKQAHSLPVFECLITREWQNTGICSIVVARMHITGNITAGIYLVDLYCLGLKDTTYQFNISPDEHSVYYSNEYAMETCKYVIAHNIIYGAIAYAEDYGFKPDKDFAVSRFILEEDDERVAEIEIEFGLDGRPCFMPGPDDSEAQIKKVIAILERSAGPGNFEVIDDFDGDDEFDDDEFDDGEEFDDDDEDHETREPSISELTDILKNINKVYDGLVRKPGTKKTENAPVGKGYKVSKGKVENEYTVFDLFSELKKRRFHYNT